MSRHSERLAPAGCCVDVPHVTPLSIDQNAGLSMVPEDILPSAWLGHVPFAFWVVEEARPDILVELGTHNGTSFLGFCQAIKERGLSTKAFAVDTWEGDEHAGHYGEGVHARLDQLVQAKYSEFAQLMRMRFDEAMPCFSDGSIDLLHIDGLHTYEAVKHDFDKWLPKMSRRGVVLFHDTMVRERDFGVWRLWEELRSRYPAFEFKHTHGLGVLLVGDEPPLPLAALCRLTSTSAEASVSNLFGALGQRFKLLDRIGQLDAQLADAVQHAANYQSMYVTAEAAMRHAIDCFGPQFEERRCELEAASAQISGLAAEGDSAQRRADAAIRGQELASVQVVELTAKLDAIKDESASRSRQLEDAAAQISELTAEAESLRRQAGWARRGQEVASAQLRDRMAEYLELQAASGVEVAHLTLALAEAEASRQSDSQRLKDLQCEGGQALATLQTELGHRDEQLQDLGTRLNLRRLELDQVLASKSWRITAPMRWVRGRLAAARRGARTPTYVDVLGPPGHQVDEPADPGIDVRLPVLPAATAEYLQENVPAEPHRRASTSLGPADTAAPVAKSLRGSRKVGRPSRRRGSLVRGLRAAAAQGARTDPRDKFDAAFYLLQYPDIAAAGLDPYRHYVLYGKAEGRLAFRPRLIIEPGGIPFDPARETILVVSHEASRTGAPVLSLNLVQELQKRYNVVAMLLGGGALVEEFRSSCTWLVGPMDLRGSAVRAAVVIDQLVDLHPLRFAVINSIESSAVLEPLARRRVAAVSLVHEFAAYTRPKEMFWNALHWAAQTVFSTPLTLESAYLEFPDLADKTFVVLPQGRCQLPMDAKGRAVRLREDSRLLAAMRPHGSSDDAFVVLGAGFVQQRKGVDLFIKCASDVLASDRGRHCRFVWIGSGYNPERDITYSVYLADQLRRAGLDQHVTIIDETFSIETAYQAADMLLLSSRLDPLPNVAIDAMAHGLPVVCFDKASGIASILAEEGLADQLVAGYLDTDDMASKVLELASSPSLRHRVRGRVLEVVKKRFDMPSYVGALERLALAADEELAQRWYEVYEIVQSGLFRLDFHGSRLAPDRPVESVLEFEYLRSWSSDTERRKPFPGFHPGMYREARGLALSEDPLFDFIRSEKPEGEWCKEVIIAAEVATLVPAHARVALHLHVYYPDMLADILERLAGNLIRPDLFVSVPDNAAKSLVEPMLATYGGVLAQVRVVPNRGRDIGPFLTAFGPELSGYDVVGHLHTKKSLDLNDSAFALRWSTFLLENLLGPTSRMADVIVGRMLADPGLGLVFPDDPHVVGWLGNLEYAKAIGNRMGLADFPKEFDFPVGTMFWVKPLAIKPLIELALDWDDYPDEPLGYDGTILHAIERLIPLVVADSGFKVAVTNIPGVSR